jgi:cytochrome c
LRVAAVSLALAGAATAAFAQATPPSTMMFEGIGRPATAKEIAAWDIDVRPDFKGLPKGKGSVAQGQEVWETKCASCHGIFGESNETYSPLVGGTTAADVKTGRVARLTDPAFPGRTTLMKLSALSTLWDYIYRAMPWNAPKSLSHDEVYAVTAFLLNLGGVLPDSFVLGHDNMAQVQQMLPNRLGTTTAHGLWPGRGFGQYGKPDVVANACMSNCATEPTVASFLPDYARNAHGNLAEQNRIVGPQHGADTTRAPGAAPVAPNGPAATVAAAAPVDPAHVAARALAQKHNCLACHAVDRKVVGPALRDVAKKHGGRADAVEYLTRRMLEGSSGVWGPVAMPAQNVPAADARALAGWMAAGAP